jgi:hypothetical protein
MDELSYVYATALVIIALGVWSIARKTFDAFAPIWMFLLGYFQVYVIQAISYHEYALRVRGVDLVTHANARAFWALLWFLLVYFCGIGPRFARALPRAPLYWSSGLITMLAPVMFLWGLVCSALALYEGPTDRVISPEENLFRQFPIMMLAAGVLLIVTGRQRSLPRPLMTGLGLAIAAAYTLLWMYNGKRSHALIGLLAAVGAFYVARGKRPSIPMLMGTGFAGALVVSLAIGWRSNPHYEHSFSGFCRFVGDFRLSSILVNINLKDHYDDEPPKEVVSYETEEYGGFLLMVDTVPEKADYDYGAPYMRLVSTYIPRILWPDKPFFGRDKWLQAWQAGSEFPREPWFTGPAISILGAAQLNGGVWGTLLVMAAMALLTRTAYEYYRLFATSPWAQTWWALTFYNAWLMTVNDDPLVWFYYIYGHTILPPMVLLWVYHRVAGGQSQWTDQDAGYESPVGMPILIHAC